MLFPETKTGAAAAYKGCKKYNPLCFVNRWGESAAMNAPRVTLFFMRENSSKSNTFIWNIKNAFPNKNLQGDLFQFYPTFLHKIRLLIFLQESTDTICTNIQKAK